MSANTPTSTPQGPNHPLLEHGKITATGDDREKVMQAKRKIRILKQALLNERKSNKQVEEKLYEYNQKLKKMELQNKKRQEKNQGLLLEIRNLKDALITQKNEKQQILQSLSQRDQLDKATASGQSKISFSNMFGLRSLFQK